MNQLGLNEEKIEKYQKTSIEEYSKALKKATEDSAKRGYTLTLSETNKITNGRYDSIWYGGEILRLENDNLIIYLNAYGDVEGDLDYNGCSASIKDRSNGGYFEGEFGYYLKNDEAYYQALNNEILNMVDNNWLELTVLRKDNKDWIDDGAGVLDSSSIIDELNDIDGIIDWAEECLKDSNE